MHILSQNHDEWAELMAKLEQEYIAFETHLNHLTEQICSRTLPDTRQVEAAVNLNCSLHDTFNKCNGYLHAMAGQLGSKAPQEVFSLESLKIAYTQVLSIKTTAQLILEKCKKFVLIQTENPSYVLPLKEAAAQAQLAARDLEVAVSTALDNINNAVEKSIFYADFSAAVETPGRINADHELRERLYDHVPRENRILLRGLFEDGVFRFGSENSAPPTAVFQGFETDTDINGKTEVEHSEEVIDAAADEIVAIETPSDDMAILHEDAGGKSAPPQLTWDFEDARSSFYESDAWTYSADDFTYNKSGASALLADIKDANSLVPAVCSILYTLNTERAIPTNPAKTEEETDTPHKTTSLALAHLLRKRLMVEIAVKNGRANEVVYVLANGTARLLNKQTVMGFLKLIVKEKWQPFRTETEFADRASIIRLVDDSNIQEWVDDRYFSADIITSHAESLFESRIRLNINAPIRFDQRISRLFLTTALATLETPVFPEVYSDELRQILSGQEKFACLLYAGGADSVAKWQDYLSQNVGLQGCMDRIYLLSPFYKGFNTLPIRRWVNGVWIDDDLLDSGCERVSDNHPTSDDCEGDTESMESVSDEERAGKGLIMEAPEGAPTSVPAPEKEHTETALADKPEREKSGQAGNCMDSLRMEPPMDEVLSEEDIDPLLMDRIPSMQREVLVKPVWHMLEENRSAVATTLLRALCSAGASNISALLSQLDYALNSPGASVEYTGQNLYNQFSAALSGDWENSLYGTSEARLMLSAILRALFRPTQKHDFVLESAAKGLLNVHSGLFDGIPSIKSILSTLLEFVFYKNNPGGFDSSALNSLYGEDDVRSRLNALGLAAIHQLVQPKTSISLLEYRRLLGFLFGQNGRYAKFLLAVSNNNIDLLAETEMFLMLYCDIDEGGQLQYSMQKIEDDLNEQFRNQFSKPHVAAGAILQYRAKNQVLQNIYKRLDIIKAWVEMHKGYGKRSDKDYRSLLNTKLELRRQIKSAKCELNALIQIAETGHVKGSLCVLNHTLCELDRTFENGTVVRERKWHYREFLASPYIALDDNLLPMIDAELNAVPGYEAYRRVLMHIREGVHVEPACWDLALERIFRQPDRGDDYSSASQIMELQHEFDYPFTEVYTQDHISHAVEEINRRTLNVRWAHFKEMIDLNASYGKITEAEKERYTTLVETIKDRYSSVGNFGIWFRLIESIDQEIETAAEHRKTEFRGRLGSVRAKLSEQTQEKQREILEYIEGMIDKGNIKGAEADIMKISSGERFTPPNTKPVNVWFAPFLKFLRHKTATFNSAASRNGSLEGLAVGRFRAGDFGGGDEFQDIRENNTLLANWPKEVKTIREENITALLSAFSFESIRVDKFARGNNKAVIQVYVRPIPKDRIDYVHPFAQFGTAIRDSMIQVVCLFGVYTPDNLVTALIETIRPETSTIILLDSALDIVQRQQIAQKIKTGEKRQMPFLLVDRVLCTFLAGLRRREDRLPALLQCCMPYTITQPYNTNGAGIIPEEMFFGRSMHLESILSSSGTNLVYGARQLGKTALLRRAQSRANYPSKREYAVYVEVLKKGINDGLKEIVLQLKANKILNAACASWEDLRVALMQAFQNGSIQKLLLLIDEADVFIDECSRADFAPISELQRLRQFHGERFKYVLAGVHNVSKQAASYYKENSPLAQLGEPLAVRPLSYQDAEELVKRPLNYLGYEIGREQLSLILVNSYFYPGLIHLFCGKLIDTVAERYCDFFNNEDCPPYIVSDDLIAAVLDQAKMASALREKLELTLKCDERYLTLAYCLGWMDILSGNGSSLEHCWSTTDLHKEVKSVCSEMEAMSTETVESLLSEMTDLGLLYRDDINRFGFRMSSYRELFCDEDKVLAYLAGH